VAHDVKRVPADIDADHGDRGIGCLRHGVFPVFGAPCQLRLLAGQEHGRSNFMPATVEALLDDRYALQRRGVRL
jgi:hypothetical protein